MHRRLVLVVQRKRAVQSAPKLVTGGGDRDELRGFNYGQFLRGENFKKPIAGGTKRGKEREKKKNPLKLAAGSGRSPSAET